MRIGFQLLLIGYLGFVNGDMVSQSLLVGWAQNGVAWRLAPGLVLLVAAAFLTPLLTRRQVYCHQLCPHGADSTVDQERRPPKMEAGVRVAALDLALPGDCCPSCCWSGW